MPAGNEQDLLNFTETRFEILKGYNGLHSNHNYAQLKETNESSFLRSFKKKKFHDELKVHNRLQNDTRKPREKIKCFGWLSPGISPRVTNKINGEDVRFVFNKLFQLYGHVSDSHLLEKQLELGKPINTHQSHGKL